ncbi:MAG: DUF4870 domain-containing protein [Acidobacteriota bacterium]
MPEPPLAETSSTGMDITLAAMLAYSLGWLTGALFLVLEKNSRFVRFHAWQSVLTFLPIFLMFWLLPLWFLAWPLVVAVWLLLMYKAFQGERFKLPVVGDIADRRA